MGGDRGTATEDGRAVHGATPERRREIYQSYAERFPGSVTEIEGES